MLLEKKRVSKGKNGFFPLASRFFHWEAPRALPLKTITTPARTTQQAIHSPLVTCSVAKNTTRKSAIKGFTNAQLMPIAGRG